MHLGTGLQEAKEAQATSGDLIVPQTRDSFECVSWLWEILAADFVDSPFFDAFVNVPSSGQQSEHPSCLR